MGRYFWRPPYGLGTFVAALALKHIQRSNAAPKRRPPWLPLHHKMQYTHHWHSRTSVGEDLALRAQSYPILILPHRRVQPRQKLCPKLACPTHQLGNWEASAGKGGLNPLTLICAPWWLSPDLHWHGYISTGMLARVKPIDYAEIELQNAPFYFIHGSTALANLGLPRHSALLF